MQRKGRSPAPLWSYPSRSARMWTPTASPSEATPAGTDVTIAWLEPERWWTRARCHIEPPCRRTGARLANRLRDSPRRGSVGGFMIEGSVGDGTGACSRVASRGGVVIILFFGCFPRLPLFVSLSIDPSGSITSGGFLPPLGGPRLPRLPRLPGATEVCGTRM